MAYTQKRQTKTEGTGFRQLLFDTIFLVENLIILITSYLTLDYEIPFELFIFVGLSQYLGIALKYIYYWKFHIWSRSFHHKKCYMNIKHSSRTFAGQKKHRSPEEKETSEINERLETSTCLRD